MRLKDFFNADHANQYLSESIIRYKGEPIYVRSVRAAKGNSIDIFYLNLDDTHVNDKVANYPHEDFDLSPIPLGMCDMRDGRGGFLARQPARMWKIGLHYRNLVTYDPNRPELPANFGARNLFFTEGFLNMVRNNYFKFEEAAVNAAKNGLAMFSREFALNNKGQLLYKTLGPVGSYSKAGPKLDDKFFYLKEMLEAAA